MKEPRVYINNFTMPKTCKECPFVVYWEYDYSTSCRASKVYIWNDTPEKTRNKKCPLRTQ